MPIPSQVLGSGNSPLATKAICGTGATGLVAVGSSQTDALQLSSANNAITTSSASTGFKLPTIEDGAVITVYNASGQTLKAYSRETSGVSINATAGSTGINVATAKTVTFTAIGTALWVSNLTA